MFNRKKLRYLAWNTITNKLFVGFSSTLIIGSAILLPITLINQHHAANQKSLIDELIQHDYSNENISENADNLSSLLDDNDKINEIVSDYTLSNQEKNDKILEIACLNGINLIDSTTIDHELEFLRNNALTQLTNTNLNNEQISACNAIINEKINLFEDKIGNEILTIEQLDQYTDSLIDQEISLHDQDNELTKEVINLQNAKDFLELITNDNLSILENCYWDNIFTKSNINSYVNNIYSYETTLFLANYLLLNNNAFPTTYLNNYRIITNIKTFLNEDKINHPEAINNYYDYFFEVSFKIKDIESDWISQETSYFKLQLIPSEELNEKNCLDILSRLEFAINHDFNVDFFEENGYEYGTEYWRNVPPEYSIISLPKEVNGIYRMDEFGQLHRLVKKPGSNVPLELINNLLLFKNANNEMHNYNSDLIKNYNVAIQLGIMTGYKGTETDINNINRLKFELAINSIFDEKYVVKNNLPINEILTKRLSSAKDFEIEQKIMQNQRQFMQEKTQYIEKQNILIECAIKTNLLEFKNNEIKKNVYFPAHIKDVYGQYQWYNGLMIGFSVADLICNILSITMLWKTFGASYVDIAFTTWAIVSDSFSIGANINTLCHIANEVFPEVNRHQKTIDFSILKELDALSDDEFLNIVYIEQILNKYQHHPNTEGFAVVKNIYDLLNDIINRFNDFVHLKQNYDWADFINEYFDKYTKWISHTSTAYSIASSINDVIAVIQEGWKLGKFIKNIGKNIEPLIKIYGKNVAISIKNTFIACANKLKYFLGGNDLMSYSTTISSCANPGVWINKLGELGGSFFIELFKPRKVWWGKQNVFDAVVVIGNYEEVLPQLQVDKINALKKLKWGVLIFSLALSITHLIVEETWGKTISNNISTL